MVSIIIPCFNVKDYIHRCFNSIKEQTFRDFEIIFVDDGSTDETSDILENIKNDNPSLNIITHFQENQGVSSARNMGMKLAKGEYLTFIDADDYIYPEFLEILLKGKELGDLSVVGIGGDGYGKSSKNFKGLITKDRFVYELWLTRHIWGSTCNKLYSKDIVLQNNIIFDTELMIMEDMFFNMVYCGYIDSIYVSDKILYYYNLNSESTMHSKFSKKNMNIIDTFHKLMSLPLNAYDRNIIELHQVNSLMWLLRTLYKDGNKQNIRQYENQIILELSYSNKKIFLKQGWKKGFLRYTTFLIYVISPSLYKYVIQTAYNLRSKVRILGK